MKVLITGCSSGFGRMAAEALSEAGHDVFATMRQTAGANAEAAAALAELERTRVHDLDVSDDESVERAVAEILADAGGLDVVINNAGVAGFGLLEGYTAAKLREVFEVNVFGVQRVCRATLPALREGGGLLMFVSSGMGRIIIPSSGAYTASKFALEALAECYAYELAGHGVEVTIVEPGTHPTSIVQKMAAWGPDDSERVADYGPATSIPQLLGAGVVQMLSGPNAPDAGAVVRAIVETVEAPKGSRPRRRVVDDLTGDGPRAINAVSDQVQGGLLEAMGLSDLCRLR